MLYGYLFTRGEAGQNMGMLIIVEFLRGLPFLEPVNDWCDYFRFFQVDCPLSVALALQGMIACCQLVKEWLHLGPWISVPSLWLP